MSKNNPTSKEEAFCYQLDDDLKLLTKISYLGTKDDFLNQLKTIEKRIKSYQEKPVVDLMIKQQNETVGKKWQVVSTFTQKAYYTGSYTQCMNWIGSAPNDQYLKEQLTMVPYLQTRIIGDISELFNNIIDNI